MNGMTGADVVSSSEAGEQFQSQIYGDTTLGAIRYNTTLFNWTATATNMGAFDLWRPFMPSTAGGDCIRQTVTHDWDVTQCTALTPSVACENVSYAEMGTAYFDFSLLCSSWTSSMPCTPDQNDKRFVRPQDIRDMFTPDPGVITELSDMWWFGETSPIYGITLMLYPIQCHSRFTIYGEFVNMNYTFTAFNSTCTYFYAVAQGQSVTTAVMKDNIANVRYVSENPMPQIMFAVIYWDRPIAYYVMDIETRHVYTWLYPDTNVTWPEAFDLCRSLGDKWNLLTVNTFTENSVASMNLTTVQPLGLFRRSTSNSFMWGQEKKAVDMFMNFGLGEPLATGLCGRQNADATWSVGACDNTVKYNRVMCEATKYVLSYTVARQLQSTQISVSMTNTPFSFIPPGGSTILYGASFFQAAGQWRPSDAWIYSVWNEYIIVMYDREGYGMLVGEETHSGFRDFLLMVQHVGHIHRRSSYRYGYVFWMIPGVRNMVLDLDTGHVYSSFRVNWFKAAPANYPNIAAYDFCTTRNMYPINVSSTTENAVVMLLLRRESLRMLIGATRIGATQDFEWSSGGASATGLSFQSWKSTYPSFVTSKGCTATSPSDWTDVACSAAGADPIPLVGCEANSGIIWGTATASQVFSDPLLGQHTISNYNSVKVFYSAGPLEFTYARNNAPIYGVSVVLAAYQCRPGQDFMKSTSTSPYVIPLYDNRSCSMFIPLTQAITVDDAKLVVDSVEFSTTYYNRSQLTFGATLWVEDVLQNWTVDVDAKHDYAFVDLPVGSTWYDAYDTCRRFGSTWHLPVITSHEEHQLLLRQLSDDIVALPLGFARLNSGRFEWFTTETITYAPWAMGEPRVGSSCSFVNASARWYTVSCTAGIFKRVMCEKFVSSYMSYTVTWMAPLTSTVGTSTLTPFPTGFVNVSGTHQTLYGTTVHQPPTQCRDGDRYAITVANDKISVAYENGCVMSLVGPTTDDAYKLVLQGVRFKGHLLLRTSMAFSFVMWTSPYYRDLLVVAPTGSLYTSFFVSMSSDVRASYPFEPAATFCSRIPGFYLAEMINETEHSVQLLTMRYGTQLIGAQRVSGNQFQWPVSGLNFSPEGPYDMWRPLQPGASGNCVVQTAYERVWDVSVCTTQIDSIACKGPRSQWQGTRTQTVTPTVPNLKVAEYMPVGTATTNYSLLRTANIANYFEDNPTVYGATVHIATHQCQAADVLSVVLSANESSWLSVVYASAPACALYFTASAPFKITRMKPIFDRIKFATVPGVTQRSEITLSVVWWTSPKATNFLLDSDLRHVYAVIDSPTSLTWSDSFSECRSLGNEWTLPAINTPTEEYLIQIDLATSVQIPIGLYLAKNNSFVWTTKEPLQYANWASARPSLTDPTEQCVEISAAGTWNNVKCTLARYQHIVCENSRASTFYFTAGLIQHSEVFAASKNFTIFTVPQLPISSGMLIRGATAMEPAVQCRDGDRFAFTTWNDDMTVWYDSGCILNLVGPALDSAYVEVLSGLVFRGHLVRRITLKFTAILWTQPVIRDLLYDESTGHFYTAIRAAASFAIRTDYGYHPSRSVCFDLGMYPVEIQSAAESLEQIRTQRYGAMFIGAKRTSLTDFKWNTSNTAFTYQFWRPLRPLADNTKDCVMQSVGFDWQDLPCTTTLASVGCEKDTWDKYSSISLTFPPTTWDPTKRRVLSLSNMQPTNSTENAEWFDDGPEIFGATVQIAAYQCRSTDVLNASLPSSDPDFNSFIVTYYSPLCALFLMVKPLPTTVTIMKKALDLVRFTGKESIDPRLQLSFGMVWWTRQSAFNMLMDLDTKKVYAMVASPTALTWDAAYDACRGLGNDWNLLAVSTYEESLLSSFNITSLQQIPLGFYTSAVGNFIWSSGDPFTFADWAATYPTSIATKKCTELRSTDKRWVNVDCFTARYKTVMCEANQYVLKYTVSYVASLDTFPASITFQIFNPSDLPTFADPATPIYGVTVMAPAGQCREERLAWNASHEALSISYDNECMLNVIGRATSAEYTVVLIGLRFRGHLMRRTSLRFAFAYWTDVNIRDIVYNLNTGHIYTQYTSGLPYTMSASYPFTPARVLCTAYGLYPAEIGDASEALEQLRSLRYGEMYLGGKRVGATAFYWNTSGAAFSYTFWLPLRPTSVVTNDCVEQSAFVDWLDIPCSTYLRLIGCEGDSWSRADFVMRFFPPTSTQLYDAKRVRLLPNSTAFSNYTLMNATIETDWVNDGFLILGLTVHLASHHCRAGDTLSLATPESLSNASLITTQYFAPDCALFINLKEAVSVTSAKEILGAVQLSAVYSPTPRAQITVAVIWWTFAGARNLLMDVDKKNVYAVVDSPSQMTWEDAYSRCRSLGNEWTLLHIHTHEENPIALFNLTAKTRVPLGLVRQLDGKFYWLNGHALSYAQWDAGQPLSTGTDRCGEVNALGKWANTPCSTPAYYSAMCQSDTYVLKIALQYVAPAEIFAATQDLPVFTAAALPAASSTTIYGATVMEPATECRKDRVALTANYDSITMTVDNDCVWLFAGVTEDQYYRNILLGLRFRGHLMRRKELHFAYVYWTNAEIRDMILDVTTGHVYTSFMASASFTPRANYPFHDFPTLCTSNALYPVTIVNERESLEQRRSLRYGEMFTAALRNGVTNDFYWDAAKTIPLLAYNMWQPLKPTTTTSLACVKQTTTVDLVDVDCTTQLNSIGCEADSWAVKGTVTLASFANHSFYNESQQRLLAYENMTIFNVMDDAVWMHDGEYLPYGVTVQIAAYQCNSADEITVDISSVPSATGITSNYFVPACALFLRSSVPRNMSVFKELIRTAQFKSTAVTRTQLTFSVILWTSSTAVNYLADPDKRHVYAALHYNTNVSWSQAYFACRGLGTDWNLVVPATPEERLLLMTNFSATTPLPIGLYTNLDGKFIRLNNETNFFADWLPGYPASMATLRGAQMSSTSGQWTNLNAASTVFRSVICETARYPLSYQISYANNETFLPATLEKMLFNTSQLPAGNTPVYGATIQHKADQCRVGDFFAMTTSNDLVSVSVNDACVMNLIGVATTTVYNSLVAGTKFRGQLMKRMQLKFSFIYWTLPAVRNMIYDVETGHAYSVFIGGGSMTVKAAYPFEPMDDYCKSAGMYAAEINTEKESMEQMRNQLYGDMFIGGRRTSATTFQWNATGAAFTYAMWRPLRPTTSLTDNCVKQSAQFDWRDQPCTTEARTIGCEINTWTPTAATQFDFPPTLSDPKTIRILEYANMTVSNTTVDADWFDDGPTIYGSTVQIAAYQCDSANDMLNVSLDSLPPFTSEYLSENCALFINAHGETSVSLMKSAIDLARFYTSADPTKRMQVMFAVIFWSERDVTNLVADTDSKHIFGFIQRSNLNWEDAYDTCRGLGYNWQLPTVRSIAETLVPQMNITQIEHTPLGMVRQANGQFGWVTSEDSIYAEWGEGYPTMALANMCTEINGTVSGGKKWFNVNCGSHHYSRIMCEARMYLLKYTLSFITNESYFKSTTQFIVFNTTQLPAADTTPVYGATVMHKADQCRPGDAFAMTKSNDVLSVSFNKECVINIIGVSDADHYQHIVSGIRYRGQLMRRTELKFAYVYWTDVNIRDMIYDMDTGHVYTAYAATASMDPRPDYSEQWSTTLMCTSHSMYVAEVASLSESLEQMRTQRYGEMYIGGRRRVGVTFKWLRYNDSFTYTMWRPLRPSTTFSDECVKQTKQFDWRDIPCKTSVPSIGCEADSWAVASSITYTFPPTTWDPTKLRSLQYTAMQVSNTTVDAEWFEDGLAIYGSTVQIAAYQCDSANDLLNVSLNSLPPFTSEYLSENCALFINAHGETSVSLMKSAIDLARFYTSADPTKRMQVMFAVIFWTESGLTNLVADTDSKHIFGFIQSSNLNWEDAYDTCRGLGYNWQLPTVRSIAETLVPQMNITQIEHTPLGMVRQANGQFGWVTSEDSIYAEWGEGYPSMALANMCTEINGTVPGGKKWFNVNCGSHHYSRIMCEARMYLLKYTLSFITNESYFKSTTQFIVFNTTQLPAADTTPVYGATVMHKADQCRPGDAFAMTKSNDVLSVSFNKECVINIIGVSDAQNYRHVVSGIRYRGQLMRRTELKFAYVYWTDVNIRGIRASNFTQLFFVSGRNTTDLSSSILGGLRPPRPPCTLTLPPTPPTDATFFDLVSKTQFFSYKRESILRSKFHNIFREFNSSQFVGFCHILCSPVG